MRAEKLPGAGVRVKQMHAKVKRCDGRYNKNMAMERLSDVIRKQSWHPGMRRKYRRRMWITIAVQIVIASFFLYRMAITIPPRDENPPQTVEELLEAIRPQIVNP